MHVMTIVPTMMRVMIITRHAHWQDENDDEYNYDNDQDSDEGDDNAHW